jgi:hypothetical protein
MWRKGGFRLTYVRRKLLEDVLIKAPLSAEQVSQDYLEPNFKRFTVLLSQVDWVLVQLNLLWCRRG